MEYIKNVLTGHKPNYKRPSPRDTERHQTRAAASQSGLSPSQSQRSKKDDGSDSPSEEVPQSSGGDARLQQIPEDAQPVPPSVAGSNAASSSFPSQPVVTSPSNNIDEEAGTSASEKPQQSRLSRLLAPIRSRSHSVSNNNEPTPSPPASSSEKTPPPVRPNLAAHRQNSSSIGLRRVVVQGDRPGTYAVVPADPSGQPVAGAQPIAQGTTGETGRRRSMSDPERGYVLPGSTPLRPIRSAAPQGGMPTVKEERSRPSQHASGSGLPSPPHDDVMSQSDVLDFEGSAGSGTGSGGRNRRNEYHSDWVDVLDTVGMFSSSFIAA